MRDEKTGIEAQERFIRRLCGHLGMPTGERVPCPQCRGDVRLTIHKCQLHGKCTTHKRVGGIACCDGCQTYVRRGMITANASPETETQHSGADIVAGLLAARGHVQLAAANYSLGSPDFAAPAVHEVTPLQAPSYALGPLVFTTPVMRRGFVRWDQGGRPRKIPADLVSDMIAKMKAWLVEKRAATPSRRIGREDCAVLEYARSLADAASVTPSDAVLLKQVIRPAFRKSTTSSTKTSFGRSISDRN